MKITYKNDEIRVGAKLNAKTWCPKNGGFVYDVQHRPRSKGKSIRCDLIGKASCYLWAEDEDDMRKKIKNLLKYEGIREHLIAWAKRKTSV